MELVPKLVGLLSEALEIDASQLQVDVPLLDQGVDPYAFLEATRRLGDALELPLPASHFRRVGTLRELAEYLQQSPAGTATVKAAAAGQPPLSRAQEFSWFVHQLAPQGSASNLACALRLKGTLDVPSLQSSWDVLLARHEVLRTRFKNEQGRAVQAVSEAGPARIASRVLSGLPPQEREAAVSHLLEEEAKHPFDLEAEGPLRLTLAQLADNDHLLVITAHELVADWWSHNLLLRELAALYTQRVQGSAGTDLAPRAGYSSFCAWEQTSAPGSADDEAYFQRVLQGAPHMLELPTDFPRPAAPSLQGRQRRARLSPALVARVARYARAQQATPFVVLHAAYSALLSRYSGEGDILVGSTAPGRALGTEDLVGSFTTPLVLRSRLRPEMTFGEAVAHSRQVVLEAYAHQHVPFETRTQALRAGTGTRLLPQQLPASLILWPRRVAPRLPGLECTLAFGGRGVATEPVGLELWEVEDGGLEGAWTYATELFRPETIDRMGHHLTTLLEAALASPELPLRALPLLGAEERHQVLVEWNRSDSTFHPDGCIHHLFEAQVDRAPDAVAVSFEDQCLSYAQLERRANQLAHLLLARGVQPEDRVVVCLRPSLATVVGLLGVLKSGAAYVTMDPDAPPERLRFMAQDAGARLLVTQAGQADHFAGAGLEAVLLSDGFSALEGQPDSRPRPAVGPDNLAYVIYTSGSTGQPKGVMVAHRSVVNHNLAAAERFALTPADRVLQFTPITFDAAGEEIYPPLLAGATVVVRGDLVPISEFSGLIERDRLTLLSLPPTFLHEWVSELKYRGESLPGGLRLVLVGGERILPETLGLWASVGGARIPWINVYGPTEATITSAMCQLSASEGGLEVPTLPIGRPIANGRIHVLDERLEPVPIGHPGELYIGGAGLARGYLARPELTAERFIPDPFSATPGARLYRSGDVARYLPDGQLEFLGRVDHQVKIRGFRIELGEIESAASKHPAVKEVLVIAHREGPGGDRLVAYVVQAPGEHTSPGDLRSFLKTRLPDYMIPSTYVLLDALPLTANGKVDRKALPPPPDEVAAVTEYVAPRTDLEGVLAEVWQEVLGLTQVGVHDDFFEIGGQSLSAMQLASRIMEVAGIDLQLRDIFEAPTVAGLAERLSRELEPAQDAGAAVDELSDDQVEAMLEELIRKQQGSP